LKNVAIIVLEKMPNTCQNIGRNRHAVTEGCPMSVEEAACITRRRLLMHRIFSFCAGKSKRAIGQI
jgi:hypothetical protein